MRDFCANKMRSSNKTKLPTDCACHHQHEFVIQLEILLLFVTISLFCSKSKFFNIRKKIRCADLNLGSSKLSIERNKTDMSAKTQQTIETD